MKTKELRIESYNYTLPDERVAKFPLERRDESKLLIYKGGKITESRFKHLTDFLPEDTLMVFNNTRVIQARLLFQKKTGAKIEIFCLEPFAPQDYVLMFQARETCEWTCLIGNLKKWKEGMLTKEIPFKAKNILLKAEKLSTEGDSHRVRFSWDDANVTFAEVLEAAGILPIPPYLHRETEAKDLQTYQTVYSKIKGSVAAPTAGLHFTPEVFADLETHGIQCEELTLHVGAGTFKPVKSETIADHAMHSECFSVRRSTIALLLSKLDHIIAVGTTSVRTLESLYYVGVRLAQNPDATAADLAVEQWMPYDEANNMLTPSEALQHILAYLDRNKMETLLSETRIIIAPGYTFKIVKGMFTNFHQPQSTLLLLVSAFVEGKWKQIYDYALANDFRFLSYGDSSLILHT